MAFPNVIERSGALSATGVAREPGFGLTTASNAFLPMMSNTLEFDPGWFSPHVMQNNRALQIYNLYGEAKFTGAVNGPLFPTNGAVFLTASVGFDNQVGFGIYGQPASNPTATTLSAPSVAGATSVTVASATGFVAGQQVVIDFGPFQETRRISSVVSTTINLSDALFYAHASGVTITTAATTTTTAGTSAATLTIGATSVAGMTPGMTLTIDTAGNLETKTLVSISGTTLTVNTPLVFAHSSGVTITAAASTTSTAATAIGANAITVANPLGFAVGQTVTVDTAGNLETKVVGAVNGNQIVFTTNFANAHASGVAVATTVSTTSSGSTVASATTIAVTATTGISVNSIIQIDVNSPSGSFTSEVRKVTNIAALVLTLDSALIYAHASGVVVTVVQAPFVHTIQDASTIPSITVEKNIGGFQSLQFSGCRIGKLDVKAPVGNNPIDITADVSGRAVSILTSPTAVSVVNENPFVFSEATLTTFGNIRNEVKNINITVDNGLKETYTYSGSHAPSFITPVTLHVHGTFETVWSSLNDPVFGDFTNMTNGTLGTLFLSFVHPSNLGFVNITIPQIVFSKFANDIKMEDVILSSMTFEATKPVSGQQLNTVTIQIGDTQYTTF